MGSGAAQIDDIKNLSRSPAKNETVVVSGNNIGVAIKQDALIIVGARGLFAKVGNFLDWLEQLAFIQKRADFARVVALNREDACRRGKIRLATDERRGPMIGRNANIFENESAQQKVPLIFEWVESIVLID
jgi:hypothetical protein